MTTETIVRRLSRWVAALSYADLPPEVLNRLLPWQNGGTSAADVSFVVSGGLTLSPATYSRNRFFEMYRSCATS